MVLSMLCVLQETYVGHSLQAALLNLATGTVVILVRRRSQGLPAASSPVLDVGFLYSGIPERCTVPPAPNVGFLYSGMPERCTAPPAPQCGLPVFRHAREVQPTLPPPGPPKSFNLSES